MNTHFYQDTPTPSYQGGSDGWLTFVGFLGSVDISPAKRLGSEWGYRYCCWLRAPVFKLKGTITAKVKGLQPSVMMLAIMFIEIVTPDNSFLGTQFQGICHSPECRGDIGFPKS